LSGLRPARWWATRLFPAFAAGFLIAGLDVVALPLLGHIAVLAGADALLLVQIMFVAQTRDFS
jgi:hypothetical protein